MVRSENFSDLIAMIVADDKQGVVRFLRGQGIAVSPTADIQEVVRSVFASLKSDKFRQKFVSWADNKYKSTANFSNANGFDPMDAQSGGAELNFSTMPPLDISTIGTTAPVGSTSTVTSGTTTSTTSGGTAVGNAIRDLGGIGGILNMGIGIWQSQEQYKQQKDLINAQIRAKELDLQKQREQGQITQAQLNAELEKLKAGQGTTDGELQNKKVLYIVGGVVLLAGIGTAIYFATRKK